MSVRRLLNVYYHLAVENMDEAKRKRFDFDLMAPLDGSTEEAKLEEKARRARENAAAARMLQMRMAKVVS